MQALTRSLFSKASLLGTSRRVLAARAFATAEVAQVKKEDAGQLDIEQVNKRLGVDTVFSEQKHAYVLTFPWNFQEIIADFEGKGVAPGSFWHKFVLNNAEYEINKTFREFHQACALPDYGLLDMVCEAKLADYVKESVRRI